MIKVTIIVVILACCLIYVGYLAARKAIRARSPRNKAVQQMRDASKRMEEAKRLKRTLSPDHPYHQRLDTIVSVSELDIQEATRKIDEIDTATLEKEIENSE